MGHKTHQLFFVFVFGMLRVIGLLTIHFIFACLSSQLSKSISTTNPSSYLQSYLVPKFIFFAKFYSHAGSTLFINNCISFRPWEQKFQRKIILTVMALNIRGLKYHPIP